MSFFGAQNTATASSTTSAADKDVELAEPPTDSISSMSFSGQADYLAVGSWDNSVSPTTASSSRRALIKVSIGPDIRGPSRWRVTGKGDVPAPRACTKCMLEQGNKIFSGGADNAGRMFDVTTGQATQVAQHDAPIKVVRWIDVPGSGLLATGSWDKTIKYWDLRNPTPVATVTLPERCYTFDVQYPLMVVGTAERHIQIFNLTNPNAAYKTLVSPLKWQTRVVSCFTAAQNNGFAVGSVEGRVAIQYVEDKDSGADAYATGSDGTIHFWDKDARTRLKSIVPFTFVAQNDYANVWPAFDAAAGPISTTTFNRNGNIFAYAISYDWSKGHSGMTPGLPNKVMLHSCKDEEVRKRPARKA
ncbi:hypothetical protein C0993_002837 [Termitomyces sp. T159_Od127]|nr:hypothetical protein C0993_002837 [Termitomyces sp. T159_Od127]